MRYPYDNEKKTVKITVVMKRLIRSRKKSNDSYTYEKWRSTFYDKMQPGEFHKKALEYAESHPYTGDAPRL